MTDTQMTLSDAIRLGATLKKQGKGNASMDPKSDATCAFGAALEAGGCVGGYRFSSVDAVPTRGSVKVPLEHYSYAVPSSWMCILSITDQCPECSFIGLVSQIVPHLNDDHNWTRERCADYVQGIEKRLAPVVVSEPVVAEELATVAR